MNKQTRRAVILIILLAVILGTVMVFYPLAASRYTEQHRSEIHADYQEAVETADTSQIDAVREAAQAWNQALFSAQIDPLSPEDNGYFDQLDPTGSGIMAYVCIPKIGVTLPIYHGCGDDVLALGAGHMPQSSLPIGGASTHAVISAHSGMASSPMFSDLELLAEGDCFQIEVLGEVLTYQVDQIQVVLPAEIDAIRIAVGEDLVTLVTCTPYGVNTHRLLVRGRRVETPEIEAEETQPASKEAEETGSIWQSHYYSGILIGLAICAGLFFIAGLVVAVRAVIQRKKETQHES